MSEDRKRTSAFIKTAFGLATGRIREDAGEIAAAANGLMALHVGAKLVAEGLISKPNKDMSDRHDFKHLIEFDFEDSKHLMQRLKNIAPEDVERLADCSESFFTALVKDKSAIPMTQKERRRLIEMMARGEST